MSVGRECMAMGELGTVRVLGACLSGTEAELVTVEARFEANVKERNEIVLTGLPDPVIRESRSRLACALEANGLHLPGGRLFLNLVPAARRKTGEILDLPLLLGAAAACGHVRAKELAQRMFLGELGIDGALHAVPGGLAAALAARRAGVEQVIAPRATALEAAWVPGVRAFGATHVEEVLRHLASRAGTLAALLPVDEPTAGVESAAGESAVRDPSSRDPAVRDPAVRDPSSRDPSSRDPSSRDPSSRDPSAGVGRSSLDDVRGQASGKLALAAAAAGGHGLLFVGPPGTGKSMLARRLGSLLEPPSLDERLEITRVLSATGRWPGGLARERPFRAPHHTVSYAGMVGGGSPPAAGEITLAHCGVLFLDELPEFRREVLEALRQPLETGEIVISRAGRRLELGARFQLVAAMNPCECGYQGHPSVPCRCPPAHVQRYRRRISGPLLDRIDLRVDLFAPSLDELATAPMSIAPDSAHSVLALRVRAARERQLARQGTRRNVDLVADELDRLAPLDGPVRSLLTRAARHRGLSARAIQALRRVARTLADLDGSESIGSEHIARAIALRSPIA
ncbi:MAG: ATP-binding protein [Planctomycetes bacterium]|nr:ATP-binding protein [Planctomycetota bacterium]